ncbi:N-acetyltransferase [Thalassovita sp.]|uniref:GNAT family N-acetyltransferase n=1 Tax=Thalassovita sp. TaxID=1979401 RepID=UPI002B268C1B|nr:N-acetyltransferase [Thalassovita sp.]
MIRYFEWNDRDQVSTLIGRAYGRSYEPWLVQALRENGDVAAEFVMEEDGAVIGCICFAAHPEPVGWWSLCTIAVAVALQDNGRGSALVRHGLDVARRQGVPAITVLGPLGYYRRFGFTRAAARNLSTPFSEENTLLYPIRPEMAERAGDLRYPQAFSRL